MSWLIGHADQLLVFGDVLLYGGSSLLGVSVRVDVRPRGWLEVCQDLYLEGILGLGVDGVYPRVLGFWHNVVAEYVAV